MPLIHIEPRNKPALRRQLNDLRTIHTILGGLIRNSQKLAAEYEAASKWLIKNGEGCQDLAPKLSNTIFSLRYQVKTLRLIADQLEETWDIGLALQKLVFHDESLPTPLEFALPIDVIGTPPTDEELGGQLHVNE